MRKQPMDRESWLGELDPWCRRWLSAPVRQTLFLAGWQSSAVGVELSDGRQAVVKVRPPTPGLAVRQTCQRQLWATGFPCPRPLTGLTRLGPFAVSAEELLPHGTDRPEPAVEVPELARVLADLVARASTVRPEGSVGPPPDWAGWDRADPDVGPWPAGGPDEVDLNASREPAWLTGTVTTVGRRLRASPLPRVVGHVDWEPPNLSWSGPAIGAVFDWDSLPSYRKRRSPASPPRCIRWWTTVLARRSSRQQLFSPRMPPPAGGRGRARRSRSPGPQDCGCLRMRRKARRSTGSRGPRPGTCCPGWTIGMPTPG